MAKMPPAFPSTNVNTGNGTLNVAGTQFNVNHYHYHGNAGFHPEASPSSKPPINFRTIDLVRSLLACLGVTSTLRIKPLLERLDEIASLIEFVREHMSILNVVPLLQTFHAFRQTQSVLDECDTRFRQLLEDMQDYQVEIHDQLPGCGFFKMAFLGAYAHSHWSRKLRSMQKFIAKNRALLEHSYALFATEAFWKGLEHKGINKVRKLLFRRRRRHFQPQSIRYLPPAQACLRDHLDRALSIPVEFCYSWMEFNQLVQIWCRGIPGANLISNDSWELYYNDNLVMTRSDASRLPLKANMVLVISIILELDTSRPGICPQCQYDNGSRSPINGRTQCFSCESSFGVSKSLSKVAKQLPKRGHSIEYSHLPGQFIVFISFVWLYRIWQTIIRRRQPSPVLSPVSPAVTTSEDEQSKTILACQASQSADKPKVIFKRVTVLSTPDTLEYPVGARPRSVRHPVADTRVGAKKSSVSSHISGYPTKGFAFTDTSNPRLTTPTRPHITFKTTPTIIILLGKERSCQSLFINTAIDQSPIMASDHRRIYRRHATEAESVLYRSFARDREYIFVDTPPCHRNEDIPNIFQKSMALIYRRYGLHQRELNLAIVALASNPAQPILATWVKERFAMLNAVKVESTLEYMSLNSNLREPWVRDEIAAAWTRRRLTVNCLIKTHVDAWRFIDRLMSACVGKEDRLLLGEEGFPLVEVFPLLGEEGKGAYFDCTTSIPGS